MKFGGFNVSVKQRINAKNYEETLRIQQEESQYAQHMQTQTANIGAYQIGRQADVGIAGAEALGQMGTNGAGTVNLGDNSTGGGINMAAMMTSMAVGGAVGQNIAGTLNNVMGTNNNSSQASVTPPPIPMSEYYVAMNGQAAGPFSISLLSQMAKTSQLTDESLVWQNGMPTWEKAKNIKELSQLFSNIPPIPEP